MEKLTLYIESLIFASQDPISINDILDTLEANLEQIYAEEDILSHIEILKEKYNADEFSFELVGISNGYQFMTKGTYHPIIGQYLKLQSRKRLSRSALETLAIIAYKQPMTKSAVEQIRGVNCDYAVQKLVEKELIEIEGRSDGPGRPLLYATSNKFMDHFGLQNLGDLPKLKEIVVAEENEDITAIATIRSGDNTEESTSTDIEDYTPENSNEESETENNVVEIDNDQIAGEGELHNIDSVETAASKEINNESSNESPVSIVNAEEE